MKRFASLLLALALFPSIAMADTLYVAGPAPVGPGHPLRLGPDHRASQVGDIVEVQFDFAVSSASTDVSNTTKGYNVGLQPGTGNAALGFLRFPTSLGGTTGTQNSKTQNGSTTFTSAMAATVTAVLPSGAMQVEGDQRLIINGQNQVMHVVGLVRPEDIDVTDTVLSTRMADVKATFNGNFQEQQKGLIRRILDFLF